MSLYAGVCTLERCGERPEFYCRVCGVLSCVACACACAPTAEIIAAELRELGWTVLPPGL